MSDATPDVHQDSRLTTWILAWDTHVLATDPTDLFQAPYFHPERDVLAYTDHSLGLGMVAAPIVWLSKNIFLAHNLTLILGLAFAAFAAFLLGSEITKNPYAGVVAGVAYAFAPYWAAHTTHIQILASGWIPMAFFGLLRWWRGGRVSSLALTTASFVMATMVSWYQGTFLAIGLVVAAGVLMFVDRPSDFFRMTRHAMVALTIAALVILPFTVPYRRVRASNETYLRSLGAIEQHSATPSSYLAAPPSNLLYGTTTARWRTARKSGETDLFPGMAILFLAGYGVRAAKRERELPPIVWVFVLVGATGIALSFGAGPNGIQRYTPWAFLHARVAVFQGLRAAARAHVLTLVGLSVLAGIGTHALMRRFPRKINGIAVAATALIVLEGMAIPLKLGPAPRPPAGYAVVRERPGAILELPLGRQHDVDYMLYGTTHWKSLANGRSGFVPQSWYDLRTIVHEITPALPRHLRDRGIRTLVLHPNRMSRRYRTLVQERLPKMRDLTLVYRSDSLAVYDVQAL